MSDSARDSSDKGDKAESQASPAPGNASAAALGATPSAEAGGGSPADSNLPVIWSPKLDASEATEHESPAFDSHEPEPPHEDTATEESSGDTPVPTPVRSSRFALLAATIAFAAALGSFLGSFG